LHARYTDGVSTSLSRIVELHNVRVGLLAERDAARSQRKSLSVQIGSLMKSQDAAAAVTLDNLKAQVAAVSALASQLEETKSAAEDELSDIFSGLPNLLDDR
jgi:seryl-tRNA synthetase